MRDAETCPFLVPVVADRLWMYPVGAYCRRPDHRIRAPAAETLARTCTASSYVECPGYRASAAGGSAANKMTGPPATSSAPARRRGRR